MKNFYQLISLLMLTTMQVSCAQPKTAENESNKVASTTKIDTLKFSSGIRAIFQDSKGNYWFGSLKEGVAIFNGKIFSYFTTNDGLTDNQIHSIQEDKAGIIWMETQNGVSSYDGKRIRNHTPSRNAASQNIYPTQRSQPLLGKWMKTTNDLWFGAGNKEGVHRYDGQELYYLDFPPHKVLNSINNLFAVTSISKGKNNMIWVSTYAGVFGYNGTDFTIINDQTLGFDRKIAALHIRSILEDSKGRLWIGNNGIGVLLQQGDSVINFSEEKGLIHPTSSRRGDKSLSGTLEHVFTIAEDSQGNIWFGDRDAGIWKYDGAIMKNYTKKDGLTNDMALSIYEDDKGKLWFGMADGTVYQYNGKKFDKKL